MTTLIMKKSVSRDLPDRPELWHLDHVNGLKSGLASGDASVETLWLLRKRHQVSSAGSRNQCDDDWFGLKNKNKK